MERSEETTPLAAIYRNVERIDEGENAGRTKVILISTGSYNPVHRMHIRMFEHCKKELEANHGCAVIGAFISPSHDKYVLSKQTGQNFCISAADRARLVEVSIADSEFGEWLFVDRWEMLQGHFVNFPQVARSLRDYVVRAFKRRTRVRVMYICGSDHFRKCGGLTSLRAPSLGVCCVDRPGYRVRRSGMDHVFMVNRIGDVDFSSTKIRKLYQAGRNYAKLMFPSAAELMTSVNTQFGWRDLD